jgi:hypothetical protein
MWSYNCEFLSNSKSEKALKYTHVLLRNVIMCDVKLGCHSSHHTYYVVTIEDIKKLYFTLSKKARKISLYMSKCILINQLIIWHPIPKLDFVLCYCKITLSSI